MWHVVDVSSARAPPVTTHLKGERAGTDRHPQHPGQRVPPKGKRGTRVLGMGSKTASAMERVSSGVGLESGLLRAAGNSFLPPEGCVCFLTAERRCATTRVVRLCMSASIVFCTRCSDTASRADVASSSNSTLGALGWGAVGGRPRLWVFGGEGGGGGGCGGCHAPLANQRRVAIGEGLDEPVRRRWKMEMGKISTFTLPSSAVPDMSSATSCAASFTCPSLTCRSKGKPRAKARGRCEKF